jgi:hypothetical protein
LEELEVTIVFKLLWRLLTSSFLAGDIVSVSCH